jgi:hypothetical protein
VGFGRGNTGEEGGEDDEFHGCGLLIWLVGCLVFWGFDDAVGLRTREEYVACGL